MEIVLGPEEVDLPGGGLSDRLAGCSQLRCAGLLSVQCCNDQMRESVPALGCREMIKQSPPDPLDVIQYLKLWLNILLRNCNGQVSKA